MRRPLRRRRLISDLFLTPGQPGIVELLVDVVLVAGARRIGAPVQGGSRVLPGGHGQVIWGAAVRGTEHLGGIAALAGKPGFVPGGRVADYLPVRPVFQHHHHDMPDHRLRRQRLAA